MRIHIDVEEGNSIVASADCEASAEDTIELVVSNAAPQLGVAPAEILLDLGAVSQRFQRESKVGDCIVHGQHWKHRRTCVQIHFETERAEHRFPATAAWGQVHVWACGHFRIPPDLCTNLELREGGPKGPALNEKKQIGVHASCESVWLVKPGPEPNGRGD